MTFRWAERNFRAKKNPDVCDVNDQSRAGGPEGFEPGSIDPCGQCAGRTPLTGERSGFLFCSICAISLASWVSSHNSIGSLNSVDVDGQTDRGKKGGPKFFSPHFFLVSSQERVVASRRWSGHSRDFEVDVASDFFPTPVSRFFAIQEDSSRDVWPGRIKCCRRKGWNVSQPTFLCVLALFFFFDRLLRRFFERRESPKINIQKSRHVHN
jgi:hypothetical protein